MKIAVAGGTGKTGRKVVDQLRSAGHQPVIIDVADVRTTSAKTARAFFGAATTNLLNAAERNGVRHHVVLSIVGVDRVSSGYYQGKLRQEELVQAGAVPWTILRATQFHEFADQILAQVPGPVAVIPKMRSQPIAVSEVAAHLCTLAMGEPQHMAPELAGPRVESVVDMARQLIRRRGQRRPVIPLRLPGAGGKAMADGALLPTQPGPRGHQTYADWLAALTPDSM